MSGRWRAAAGWWCVGMVGVFAALSWMGGRGRSATVDEPMEGVSAYAVARDGEYRAGVDTPPLAKRWAMLLEPGDAIDLKYQGPAWAAVVRGGGTWLWTRSAYLAAGPARADAFLARARVMMLVLGAAVVAVAGRWGWEMGGPVAGMVAAGLVAFDPNFLGNAPLMKTDVAVALVFGVAGWAAWHVGRDGRLGWVALMALAAGAGPVVKYSGVVLPVLVCGVMLARVFVGGAVWRVGGRAMVGRGQKLAGWAVLSAMVAAGTLLVMWAAYGFGSGPVVGVGATDAVGRAARQLAAWHVVPRVWAGGLAQQRGQAAEWPAYLLGRYSRTGWWYYFPLAWGFKEPVGIILGVVAAVAWMAKSNVKSDKSKVSAMADWGWWDKVAVGGPAVVYAAAAMGSNVNAGLRHFLVVLPFLYVGVGVIAGRAVAVARARRVVAGLGALVVVEVLWAYPSYLAFFNWPARADGPMRLLGDANLDWGQDLKGLVAWQREHEGVPLYAAYFGVTPPEFYGLRYVAMPGVPFFFEPGARWPTGPGVMAVSATIIQGIYAPAERRAIYAPLMQRRPLAVIGGTIFLYETNGGMP